MVLVGVPIDENDVGTLIADPSRRRAAIAAPDRAPAPLRKELDHPRGLHLIAGHVAHELAATGAALDRSHATHLASALPRVFCPVRLAARWSRATRSASSPASPAHTTASLPRSRSARIRVGATRLWMR